MLFRVKFYSKSFTFSHSSKTLSSPCRYWKTKKMVVIYFPGKRLKTTKPSTTKNRNGGWKRWVPKNLKLNVYRVHRYVVDTQNRKKQLNNSRLLYLNLFSERSGFEPSTKNRQYQRVFGGRHWRGSTSPVQLVDKLSFDRIKHGTSCRHSAYSPSAGSFFRSYPNAAQSEYSLIIRQGDNVRGCIASTK